MNEDIFVPVGVYFQGCYNPYYEAGIMKCKEVCYEYNSLRPSEHERRAEILGDLLGGAGRNPIFEPPFFCDYGGHIFVGDDFYANRNLVVNDGAEVRFGNNVFVGPNCCFTTAEHALDPKMRKAGVELAKPITVGDNVWIGAGSIVLAGAKIGDNTVIGAGSVVKGEIPSGVVAVGVPCRVLRKITAADRTAYPLHESIAAQWSDRRD